MNGTLKHNIDIDSGWLHAATRCPSPNYNKRPANTIDLLVIHNISLPAGEFGGCYIDDLFLNQLDFDAHPSFFELRELKVSSHLLIRRAGTITQYVAFDQRAWHAGVSYYGERANCNDFSIGIELEGDDNTPYTDEQYRVLSEVASVLIRQYSISPRDIVGHCDIAPKRKTDPGPSFDWEYFQKTLEILL